MFIFLMRRLVQIVPVLLGVTLMVFLIMQMVPGDPAVLVAGEGATDEQVEAIRHDLGLDQPLAVQYLSYVGDVVKGDFGESIRTSRPVLDEILVRLPITLELAFWSIVITVVLGVLIGIIAATKQNSFTDVGLMMVALLGVSLPNFWLGLMLIIYFSVGLQWFPVAGWGTFSHIILPAITLGTGGAAIVARMTRASMLEVIRQDYIRTAKAKGVRQRLIIYKHALKNALIPVITVVGLQFGALLGGTVLTESVFAINGVGRLIIDAIRMRDLPLVQGSILFVSVLFVIVNLLVDLSYRFLNKRVELN
ncbi:nickel ABC transporter permease [Cytobacillus firmus]|uniref:nickel ABC transporter permease n=1 Tax=Cytobacillus firmus TaxID=1399 RepID=UPI00077C6CA8|nr:nickel ABC transporter permease [Cytobacillus firmus]MBG9542315.1 peptide ABC transporter permease [Cytobacillus firmus]MBG9548657.1 peptide ABC transporter permease [Cytobacillus firmus]MBG9553544.1 peptide ABC transporter permease [Cytobacillus firmus]MBG9557734.1 peptide ABC transporter permease [Cytobacillus firmus]MBG9573916.1 peptide ABC transporter permease [Cytobacillus firmus]